MGINPLRGFESPSLRPALRAYGCLVRPGRQSQPYHEGVSIHARFFWFASLLVLGCASGCVERELVVQTTPPGARVYVDGVDQGVASPEGLRVPFEHYRTLEVVARLAGHTPARRLVEVEAPWWQVFPIGLAPDVLWPGTIKDEHPVRLELAPREPPPAASELEARAREAEGLR